MLKKRSTYSEISDQSRAICPNYNFYCCENNPQCCIYSFTDCLLFIKIKKNLTKVKCKLGFDHDRIRHQTGVVPAISDNVANNGGADV